MRHRAEVPRATERPRQGRYLLAQANVATGRQGDLQSFLNEAGGEGVQPFLPYVHGGEAIAAPQKTDAGAAHAPPRPR